MPAPLFRTTVRLDFGSVPWHTVAAFFLPTLLVMLTALAELDLARARRGAGGTAATPLLQTLGTTPRNTVIHPVVLPVVAGLRWNATGQGLHPGADAALVMLGSAVVPWCRCAWC